MSAGAPPRDFRRPPSLAEDRVAASVVLRVSISSGLSMELTTTGADGSSRLADFTAFSSA